MTQGSLRVTFNQNGKIDVMEHFVSMHHEYVPRTKLQPAPESPEQKSSPSLTKSAGKRAAQQKSNKQQAAQQEQSAQLRVPPTVISSFGVTNAVFYMLEVNSSFPPNTEILVDSL